MEKPELVQMILEPLVPRLPIVEFKQPRKLAAGYQTTEDPNVVLTPVYSSLKWTDIDGMLHVQGGACCSCDYSCPRCGGSLHKQGVHGGMAYCCEHCNAKDWKDPPQPLHDEAGVIITEEKTQ